MLTSKKGISARQLWRMMDFGSLKTAWYMAHRLRAALANEDFRKLVGSSKSMRLSSAAGKEPALGQARAAPGAAAWIGQDAHRRCRRAQGKVVTRVIGTVSSDLLKTFVRGAVSEKSACGH